MYHWRKNCCTGQKCQLAYSTVELECWYNYSIVCNLRYIVIIYISLLQTILGFIIVGFLSRKIPDRYQWFLLISIHVYIFHKLLHRWQILFGLGLELFGYAWLLGTIGNASYGILCCTTHACMQRVTMPCDSCIGTPWVLWRFIVGIVPILFGLPFFVVTGAALYSKFLPMKIQGK